MTSRMGPNGALDAVVGVAGGLESRGRSVGNTPLGTHLWEHPPS